MSQRTLYTDPAHLCRPLNTRLASSDSGYETGPESAPLLSPSETTSLLAHAISPSLSSRDILVTAEEGESDSPKAVGITPVPTKQLVVLCICRIADPVVFSQIFPYINEMLSSLALEPERIPFYAGLVESSFAIAQLATIYFWARLSDRFGRRPIIFLGALGMATATMLFGLSKSLTAILCARSLGGLFSGNVAVMHSTLGELTDATNQALAFPIYGLAWPLGTVLGPLIGGTFSNPASQFPSIFTGPFWHAHPYFLPSVLAACFSIGGVTLGYFFLQETLPSKLSAINTRPGQEDSDKESHGDSGLNGLSTRELLALPALRALCVSGAALSFVSTAFDVTFVLSCYKTVENGGLGFSAAEIGMALALAGALSGLIQVFLTPILLARCDLALLYRISCLLWAPAFLCVPLLSFCLAYSPALLWVAIAALLGLSKVAGLAYATGMILVKDAAPSASELGAANGLVQTFMCGARSFAPAAASALFGTAVGGWWAVALSAIALGGWTLSWNVVCEGEIDRDAATCAFE
ncbi:MFS general substrate transporter [Peniophora sp. CONT]|nr:MFS general substrate transporter [Peniophora sp. CONT]